MREAVSFSPFFSVGVDVLDDPLGHNLMFAIHIQKSISYAPEFLIRGDMKYASTGLGEIPRKRKFEVRHHLRTAYTKLAFFVSLAVRQDG